MLQWVSLQLATELCPQQRLDKSAYVNTQPITAHTIKTSVVRFYMGLLHSTILNDKSISFRAIASKDGRAVERQAKRFGEAQAWVTKEANLMYN